VRNAERNIIGTNRLGQHVQYPGLRGTHNTKLVRTRSTSLQRKNNYWACKGLDRRGETCDEYPFASTVNGAYYNRDPLTWRKRMPADQNSGVGRKLGSFYSAYRVLSADQFWLGFDYSVSCQPLQPC
jgi:hypothetical protein